MTTILEIFERNNFSPDDAIYRLFDFDRDANVIVKKIKQFAQNIKFELPKDHEKIIIMAGTSKRFKNILKLNVINCVLENKTHILETLSGVKMLKNGKSISDDYTENQIISAVINCYLNFFEDSGILNVDVQDLLLNNASAITDTYVGDRIVGQLDDI